MMHNDMMVGAFSHSTAVGKLRRELPDVPPDARVSFPRFTLDEAEAVCHYYLRYVPKAIKPTLLTFSKCITQSYARQVPSSVFVARSCYTLPRSHPFSPRVNLHSEQDISHNHLQIQTEIHRTILR